MAKWGIFNAANNWRMAILFIPGVVTGVVLPMLSSLNDYRDRKRYLTVSQGERLYCRRNRLYPGRAHRAGLALDHARLWTGLRGGVLGSWRALPRRRCSWRSTTLSARPLPAKAACGWGFGFNAPLGVDLACRIPYPGSPGLRRAGTGLGPLDRVRVPHHLAGRLSRLYSKSEGNRGGIERPRFHGSVAGRPCPRRRRRRVAGDVGRMKGGRAWL